MNVTWFIASRQCALATRHSLPFAARGTWRTSDTVLIATTRTSSSCATSHSRVRMRLGKAPTCAGMLPASPRTRRRHGPAARAAGVMIWYIKFLADKVNRSARMMAPVTTTVDVASNGEFFDVPVPAITVCLAVAPQTGDELLRYFSDRPGLRALPPSLAIHTLLAAFLEFPNPESRIGFYPSGISGQQAANLTSDAAQCEPSVRLVGSRVPCSVHVATCRSPRSPPLQPSLPTLARSSRARPCPVTTGWVASRTCLPTTCRSVAPTRRARLK